MTSYATPQNFIDTFGAVEALRATQIDSPGATEPNLERLQVALDDATDEINSYIQQGYKIADLMRDPPRRLKGACLDIARYRLVKNRPPEDYRQRYEDVIAWLKDVAKGVASLGVLVSGEELPSTDTPVIIATPRIFTMNSMRSY
ncbi:MAG TPA: phage protein Gp36 family protein [Trichocoleus sp.]